MIDDSISEKNDTSEDTVDVQIKFVDRKECKPPMEDLLLDVTLRNRTNEQRWFIIPSNIQSRLSIKQSNHTVQLYKTCRQGCLTFGKLLGKESYYVILLQSNAEIKIEGLPITLWNDEDNITESVQLSTVIAKEIRIEGTPLQNWIGIEWISDLKAKAIYSDVEIIGAKYNPDLKALPVEIAIIKRSEFTIKFK